MDICFAGIFAQKRRGQNRERKFPRACNGAPLPKGSTVIEAYSVVGIATRYGLNGPRIESRWGARFFTPVQTGPGANAACCAMGTGPFLGVKRPGRGVYYPPHLASRLKKEWSYTSARPSGPSWPVLG